MSDGVYWNFTSTCPHCGGVFSVVAGQQQPHECGDEPSSGEAGSGFRGVARSGQNAATGAGAIAVPPVPVADQPPRTTTCGRCHPAERCSCQDSPVPVAAQPRYILDKDAILDLVERYGEACLASDWEQAAGEFDAIRVALTPVPASEPEPAWGSGPLVKHVTETPAEPQMPYLTGQPVSFVDDGDGQAVQR